MKPEKSVKSQLNSIKRRKKALKALKEMKYGLVWLGFIGAIMTGSPIVFVGYILFVWFASEYDRAEEE